MNLDIRTLILAIAVVVFVNAFVLTVAWHYAKSMRAVIGYWSLSQVLAGFGIVLVACRGVIPDFYSVIIANACITGGQIALQEGIARYMGKTGYLRATTLIVLAIQVALICFLTYVVPAVGFRIVAFSLATGIISGISILTLRNTDTAIDAPRRFLLAVMVFYVCITIFRAVSVILQGYYVELFNAGSLQALGIIGILCFCVSVPLCFFWLIAHRLGLEVQRQALTDSLTGISNRRAMDEFLEEQLPVKAGWNMVIFLIDVDNFKRINDQFGHQAGDLYLIQLCRVITCSLRQGDAVFRYAGDEFVVVIQNVDQSSALQAAERLRQSLEQLSIPWRGEQIISSVSIGLAQTGVHVRNWDDLMRIADEALYSAKNTGGNCVKIG